MTDDEVIYILPPETPPATKLSADKEHKYKATLSAASVDMRIGFWFTLILSSVNMLIVAVILLVSKSLSMDRKLFIGGIVELVVLSLQIMLCMTRNDHRSLTIFVIVCTQLSAMGLGMCIRLE